MPDGAADPLIRRPVTAQEKEILVVSEEFRYEPQNAAECPGAHTNAIDDNLTAVNAGEGHRT